jgi:formylglycine-generating enzyme required for sulfatase activity
MKSIRLVFLGFYLIPLIELAASIFNLLTLFKNYLYHVDGEYIQRWELIFFGATRYNFILMIYEVFAILFVMAFIWLVIKNKIKYFYFLIFLKYLTIFVFGLLINFTKNFGFFIINKNEYFFTFDLLRSLILNSCLLTLVPYIIDELKNNNHKSQNYYNKFKSNLIYLISLFLFVLPFFYLLENHLLNYFLINSNIKIVEPQMVLIKGGSFMMGTSEKHISSFETNGHLSLIRYKEQILNEMKQRFIHLKNFEISQTEITNAQFNQFINDSKTKIDKQCSNSDESRVINVNGAVDWEKSVNKFVEKVNWQNPGFEQTENHPATCITWADAQKYVRWLNKKTGKNYRLMSEAEWEYVAKAGCTTQYNVAGQCAEKIEPSQANFDGRASYNGSQVSPSYKGGTSVVASYAPNSMNVFDMHGNVAEYVQDCYENNYLNSQPTDGSAHRAFDSSCRDRVIRGGSWANKPYELRASSRNYGNFHAFNSIGFRVARTLP